MKRKSMNLAEELIKPQTFLNVFLFLAWDNELASEKFEFLWLKFHNEPRIFFFASPQKKNTTTTTSKCRSVDELSRSVVFAQRQTSHKLRTLFTHVNCLLTQPRHESLDSLGNWEIGDVESLNLHVSHVKFYEIHEEIWFRFQARSCFFAHDREKMSWAHDFKAQSIPACCHWMSKSTFTTRSEKEESLMQWMLREVKRSRQTTLEILCKTQTATSSFSVPITPSSFCSVLN